jgi:UDP-GlcNAc3NAcA epimerase
VSPKVLNVVGARPQFVKAAAVCRALRARDDLTDVLVHTGQHYDPEMSDVFFTQLGLPQPDRSLGIGGGSHGAMTGRLLEALEAVMLEEQPALVLVYGDTNTTLAAALAAAKLQIPVGHVEGGMRSFNRAMPEEINRVMSDHLASLHLCSTPVAVANLKAEGITEGVHLVGDVMCDILQLSLPHAADAILAEVGVTSGDYYAMTLHRAGNTDDPARLEALLTAAAKMPAPVVFPVHPRTRQAMDAAGIKAEGALRLIPPVGYFEFLALQRGARAIITDSGGVQKEAYMLGVPCITMRADTEWTETVDAGWNVLVDADGAAMLAAAERTPPAARPDLYGDGHAADLIARLCAEAL